MKNRGHVKNCTNPFVVNGKIAILLRQIRAVADEPSTGNHIGYFIDIVTLFG
jgi:hypothetical protein